MSSQSRKTKTYKRYPATDALKKGSASTIESACVKIQIAEEYVNLRDKYRGLKNEYQKSHVKLEQMEQLKKDNFKLISDSQKKSDTIKKLQITNTQLNGDIQLLKETTNDRGDYQRLEGFLKKKDLEIEELKSQIDDEKPNNCATIKNLQNIISKLKEQLENYKKNELARETFMVEKYDMLESLKKENEALKQHITLIQKDNKDIKQKITDLYDSL